MRAAIAIAGKDLRLRLRDRSALVVAFVAPLLLASIVSFAFAGDDGSFSTTIAVADMDGSDISRAFLDTLSSDEVRGFATVSRVPTGTEARRRVADGKVAAAIVVPADFGATVTGGGDPVLTVVVSPDAPVSGQVAESIARAFTEQINAVRAAVFTAITLGAPFTDAGSMAARAAAAPQVVALSDGEVAGFGGTIANYFGPSMAMFFLFFTVGLGARGIVAERTLGTLARMSAAPVRPWAILAGKAAPLLVLGLASLAVVYGAMSLLFGVSWGDPLAVAVVSVGIVVATFAVAGFAQTLARTEEQAGTYGSVVAIVFTLAGGNFFPVWQLPDVMQRVALLTPNGAALRAMTRISYDGATVADLGPTLATLAAFAAVFGAAASVRARRMVTA